MEQFKFIWLKLQNNRIRMFAMFIAVIFYVSLMLLSPLFFSFFVDNVIGDVEVVNPMVRMFSDWFGGVSNLRENLWIGGVIIIVISAFTGVAMYWRGRLNGEISENVTLKIRDEVYRHLQRLPYSYHVNAKTGDLIQRCTSDVDQIRRFLAAQISELVYAIALSLIAGAILFSIHAPLAWLSIISLPIIFAFAYIFFIKMQKAFKESDESEGEMSAVIQENLSGTRVVKAFSRESYELDKFEKKNAQVSGFDLSSDSLVRHVLGNL
jgi:ATP-binding cassette, subfamily B, bacterial